MSRRSKDIRDALLWGMSEDDARQYAERCALFDRETIRRGVADVEAGLDSRAAMLARIDAVIADLADQLGAEVVPWPT